MVALFQYTTFLNKVHGLNKKFNEAKHRQVENLNKIHLKTSISIRWTHEKEFVSDVVFKRSASHSLCSSLRLPRKRNFAETTNLTSLPSYVPPKAAALLDFSFASEYK